MPEVSATKECQPSDGAAVERLAAKRLVLHATVAAGAVHELNNYLGRIVCLAEMAMDEVADRPVACAELRTLISTAEQAAGLVKQLDSSASGALGNPSFFDLGAIVDAACCGASGALHLTRHSLIPLGPWWVFADQDLVLLSLDALLRDADRRSARRVDILCQNLPSGREAEVVLTDDGIGMVFEDLAGAAASESGGRLEVDATSERTVMRLVLPVADDALTRVSG